MEHRAIKRAMNRRCQRSNYFLMVFPSPQKNEKKWRKLSQNFQTEAKNLQESLLTCWYAICDLNYKRIITHLGFCQEMKFMTFHPHSQVYLINFIHSPFGMEREKVFRAGFVENQFSTWLLSCRRIYLHALTNPRLIEGMFLHFKNRRTCRVLGAGIKV